MTVNEQIINRFIKKLSDNDYVGVEIEMPLVNNRALHMVDSKVVAVVFDLFVNSGFESTSYDNLGNVISVTNKENGDVISLEYSFNTLEFSISKAHSIFDLEKRFIKYYNLTIGILEEYNYKIVGCGINPYYHEIDRHCLNQDRYITIERLLKKGESELMDSFCAYCCSVQTHINSSVEDVINKLNIFTRIEAIKSNLFANSYMSETGVRDSRSYMWRNSNFGPYNNGTNPLYSSIDDLINDYLHRNLFFAERNGKYYLFEEKQQIEKYFSKKYVYARDIDDNRVKIIPMDSDFENFRSYRGVELTKYGTLEIRTDCTQPVDKIFKMVAFNVGVAANSNKINNYMKEKGSITKEVLMQFAIEGLKNRTYGEERYWE